MFLANSDLDDRPLYRIVRTACVFPARSARSSSIWLHRDNSFRWVVFGAHGLKETLDARGQAAHLPLIHVAKYKSQNGYRYTRYEIDSVIWNLIESYPEKLTLITVLFFLREKLDSRRQNGSPKRVS